MQLQLTPTPSGQVQVDLVDQRKETQNSDIIRKLYSRVARLESALDLIAAPQRSDGTWNRDRLACQQLAVEALKE